MPVDVIVEDARLNRYLRDVAKSIPDGYLGRVYNRGARQKGRRYDLYVMSDKRQSNIHRDRWPTDLQIARQAGKPISDLYANSLKRSIRGRDAKLKATTNEALDYLMNEVTEEAYKTPPPPGSTYIRTRTLYRAWDRENKVR